MIKGVIFDLDGVVVSTDEYHYQAWKAIADEEGIPFDRETNNFLRGISRRDSLEIILRKATKEYSEEEKIILMDKKNRIYVSLLENLTPNDILPGFLSFLDTLKNNGIKTAVGSSSKNTRLILGHLGLLDSFDAIADGNEITHSKPNPEVFLLAGRKISLAPEDCAVIEDAISGVEAAKAADMIAVGIKDAKKSDCCTIKADSFSEIQTKLGL